MSTKRNRYELEEQELNSFAKEISEMIIIRRWESGNSRDIRRKSKKDEKEKIRTIILGGLLAIVGGRNSDDIIDACEFIALLQLEGVNAYDTIYIPMQEWTRNN